MSGVRVDVWVWAARLAKTRSQATAACKAGHIKVNGATAKPAHNLKLGDTVRSTLYSVERIYRVEAFATKRGSAAEAAALFTDLTPKLPPKPERPAEIVRERGAGRPSKRERRQLDALRGFVR
ncbi:RNA-binding S4 domain-containing protein [Canibacter zhoujuaniae]|uniref:RNA-binding S4 domain-containing protein n=1 Tax=Canibacter zhoujuaniae TaxID=2708343 RepID=UPI00142226FD|nr:RNA-binding S4 domain-containing protein [Canibacter zhoujuaniae]